MTAEQMREMAAKKAEEWIYDHEWEWSRSEIRLRQNDVAQEIASAIRALPLEAGQRPARETATGGAEIMTTEIVSAIITLLYLGLAVNLVTFILVVILMHRSRADVGRTHHE
jgi:hypothetical protein